MKTLTIKLPTPYPEQAKVLEENADTAVIETSPGTQIVPSLGAWLLLRALKQGGNFLWSSAKPMEMYNKMLAWVAPLGIKGKNNVIKFPNASIIFVKPDDLPDSQVQDAVIADADISPEQAQVWVAMHVQDAVRYVGSVASSSHWFYRFARAAQKGGCAYHRVSAADAARHGVIDRTALERTKAALPANAFRRQYLCEVDQEERHVTSIKRFCRERLYIRTKDGQVVNFQLNPIQHRYLAKKRLAARIARAEGRPARFLLLKYRRGGFTTLEQALSYEAVQQENVQCVTLAHTKDSTKRIFRIASLFHKKDPEALEKTRSDNAIEIPELNSLFFIGTAGASGFGRGDTLQRVHGSEVSKWCEGPNQLTQVDDILAGLTEAASHGEVTLETTPNGHEWFCQQYKEAKKGTNNWIPIFLPWFEDRTNRMTIFNAEEISDTLDERERTLIERFGLDFSQIAWRRMKVKDLKRLFPQEYPEDDETCFLTSGSAFFDNDDIIELLESLAEYDRKHVAGGYYVEWEAPQAGLEYVLGADTSEGVAGGDPSGFGVLRRDNGAQVAALHGLFKPDVLAGHIAKAHVRWNKALLGVERENHGHSVLQKLRDLGLGKTHEHGGPLYHFQSERSGWSTSGETRPIMLDELQEAVGSRHMKVKDRDFLGECLTFRLQKNGKFAADTGCHDDTVLKWAIAWQMRKVKRRRIGITVGG